MAKESTIRVTIADNIARKPENGNLCHGLSFKQLDDNMSKESGKTCMKPVASMMPAAKDLTMRNRFLSGCSAGIERVTRGKHTPIMLVTRMETMAMILRGNALALSLQELMDSVPHSSDTEKAWGVKVEKRMMKMEMSFTSEVAIDSRY